jgi:hypothetical protein
MRMRRSPIRPRPLVVSVGILVAVAATLAAPVQAKRDVVVGANLNIYKSPKKSDCDIKVPAQFSTVQAGVDAATPGDTVCVAPGTSTENVLISHSIRLAGGGAANTILAGQTTDTAIVRIDGDGNADNTILEGFQIRGVDNLDPDRNDSPVVNIGSFSSGAIVRHNKIVAGYAQLPIRADSGQQDELIYNNVLQGDSSPETLKVSGVQGPSGTVDIRNNTFTGTVDATIPNFSGAGTVLDSWSTNSVIAENAFNTTGTIDVIVASAYASNTVTRNNLNSSATVKVGTYSGGALSAEDNWWGDLDPSDSIFGDVDFTPFATKPFAQTAA